MFTPFPGGPRPSHPPRPRPLAEAELAHVRGGAGDLAVSVQTPPLRGTVDLTYAGARASLGASLAVTSGAWSGGLNAGVALGRARLEGSYRTNGQAWEAQVTMRIPLGRR